jgi:pyruvate/2-oxoglutarate/acetoin dehydrogenase E1 component
MFDPELYRTKAEVEEWKTRDPIAVLTSRLREREQIDDAGLMAIQADVRLEIDDAVAYAEAGTWEPVEQLTRDVYTPRTSPGAAGSIKPAPGQPMIRTTYREAARLAVRDALVKDARVFLMGEDVGRYGGAYAVSKGLLEEFGPERIRDTPLSESGFVGAGIGAALGGARPIVEVMTVNFCLLALDQIVNNAATIRHMSGGQFSVPLVIRMATGAGRQLAAQHSNTLEAWYAHVPGLKVVAAATLDDARGMVLAALDEPNPVVIFEYPALFEMKGELSGTAVDLSSPAVRRKGSKVTLVTYGACLPKTLKAAEEVDGEVIDLRSLRPLDLAPVMDSVRKTRRAVVVDEGWRSGSLAAEVMARIAEECFYDLDAPLARVCREEVPIPYAKHLEEAALPQPEKIVAAARSLFA